MFVYVYKNYLQFQKITLVGNWVKRLYWQELSMYTCSQKNWNVQWHNGGGSWVVQISHKRSMLIWDKQIVVDKVDDAGEMMNGKIVDWENFMIRIYH